MDLETLQNNLASVKRRIREACHRCGRTNLPRLLVASKYFGVEEMGLLVQAGIRLVGENRAEELVEKWERWSKELEFHFIGHLQSRKARMVLPRVTLIHSVDSLSLVRELDKRAQSVFKVLLEVNMSGEKSKYGILPEAAESFLAEAAAYPKVEFVGLMTMAPLVADPEQARPCFRGLRELRDRLAPVFGERYQLSELSMGMSNDFEVAVEEGATIVRIGSALLSS